ncbi:MAG: DUF2877 domain-containing protein [Actinomycetota bacterium]
MTHVAAASLSLRGVEDPGLVVWEPIDGPRFPNGVVALDGGAAWCAGPAVGGRVQARRWWDPRVPSAGLDAAVVTSFVEGLAPVALPDDPARLIGWGPGLTPAGDDVVVGMLIAYHASGRADLAAALAANVAGADTAPFSQALLHHATHGEAAAPVLSVVRALAGHGSLSASVADLQAFGATSGHHILDGLRRALLEVGAPAASQRQPVATHIAASQRQPAAAHATASQLQGPGVTSGRSPASGQDTASQRQPAAPPAAASLRPSQTRSVTASQRQHPAAVPRAGVGRGPDAARSEATSCRSDAVPGTTARSGGTTVADDAADCRSDAVATPANDCRSDAAPTPANDCRSDAVASLAREGTAL